MREDDFEDWFNFTAEELNNLGKNIKYDEIVFEDKYYNLEIENDDEEE